jgi:uncharacterized HAD superfamily protein
MLRLVNMSFQKTVLAIDVDEVICHFVPHLIDFHNENYESDLTVDTFHNYQFHKGKKKNL